MVRLACSVLALIVLEMFRTNALGSSGPLKQFSFGERALTGTSLADSATPTRP